MSRFHPASPDYRRGVASQIRYDPMTAIMIGLHAVSAISQISDSKAQAKATIAEGNIAASNKAQEVARKAASQRVSFLNSGLTLEGTPMNVIESTFNTGLQDIKQIRNNYNMQSKNQISAGRTAALSSLASGFGAFAMGGSTDVFSGSGSPGIGAALGGYGSRGTTINDMPWLT